MALLTCPDCGNKVSDKAASCPSCGCPITEYRDKLIADEAKTVEVSQRQHAKVIELRKQRKLNTPPGFKGAIVFHSIMLYICALFPLGLTVEIIKKSVESRFIHPHDPPTAVALYIAVIVYYFILRSVKSWSKLGFISAFFVDIILLFLLWLFCQTMPGNKVFAFVIFSPILIASLVSWIYASKDKVEGIKMWKLLK